MSDPVSVIAPAPAPAAAPILPSDAPPAGEPTLFAGKYKTVEELESGYKNLESKLGAPKPAAAAPAAAPAAAAPKGVVPPIANAEAAVASAGLNFEELNTEYAESGTITDASYEKLAKVGISKDIVDAYIAGQVALTEKTQTDIYSTIGGEENYTTMLEWAAQNLEPADKLAFNSAITGTVAQAKLAVAGLYSQFTASEGVPPSLVKGTGSSGGGGYESMAQFIADIQDPRYSKDPAYRAAVAEKRSRSAADLS
jgi:hypothetical protein